MQRSTALYACIMTALALWATPAVAVPLTLSHQGRLLDGSDQPVTGVHTLTVRMFDAASGGSPLWIEVHPSVQVADGLYELALGSVTPLDAELLSPPSGSGLPPAERYLEIEVDGDGPMSPRVQLRSTPYSVATARVSGDIETSPGAVRLGGPSGSTTPTIRMMAMPDSGASIMDLDSDGDGLPDQAIEEIMTPTTSSVAIKTRGTGADKNRVVSQTNDSGVVVHLTSDTDGDGLPDQEIQQIMTPTTSSVAINTKGTGAAKGRVAALRSETTVDSASLDISTDDDGDGTPEAGSHRISKGVFYGGPGTLSLQFVDADDDGEPEQEISSAIVPTRAQHAINTKGTGAQNGRVVSVSSGTTVDSATSVCVMDLDGDGSPELAVEQSTTTSSARLAIKTKGTGAHRFSAGGDCDDSDASLHADYDADNDGVAEATVRQTSGADGASLVVSNIGSSGQDGVSIAADATARRIRVGNLGSSGEDGVEVRVDDTSRKLVLSNIGSSGQDGVRLNVDGSLSSLSVSNIGSSGQDGVSIDAGASSRRLTVSNIGSSGQDGVEVRVDASARRLAVGNIGSSGQDGVNLLVDDSARVVSAGDSSLQVTMGTRKGWDGTVKGSTKITDGADRKIEMTSDGNGYFDNAIGVGVDPVHRIDVTGGAYCDGTDWVNGSDVNSKENFEPVNGEELLDRIAELQITRWNYKGQPDVAHIGPMAQDFQTVFGVGVDDKSISTIDPSGIALAALKELYRQNQELHAANRQLQEQMEELRRMMMALKTR